MAIAVVKGGRGEVNVTPLLVRGQEEGRGVEAERPCWASR